MCGSAVVKLYNIQHVNIPSYIHTIHICMPKISLINYLFACWKKNYLASDSRVYNATKFGTHFRACQECVSISIRRLVFLLSPTNVFFNIEFKLFGRENSALRQIKSQIWITPFSFIVQESVKRSYSVPLYQNINTPVKVLHTYKGKLF